MFGSLSCLLVGHKWGKETRVFTPPEKLRANAEHEEEYTDPDLFERLAFGFTMIEQTCDRCKLYHARRVTGDQRAVSE